jgi:hypothetical protein
MVVDHSPFLIGRHSDSSLQLAYAADPRILRADYAPLADPLRVALALGTTPGVPAPAFISGAARYVRTTVAPGRLLVNAVGVVVDTWQLGQAAT